MRLIQAAFLMSVGACLAACAVPAPGPGPNPYPPPPAPVSERVPKPPVSEEQLVWQPGHYDWNSASYTWRPGRWVPQAGHGSAWLQEHWAIEGGQWVWIPAHWV